MASTPGNLDEFFDFARLEADIDNGLLSQGAIGEPGCQDFPVSEQPDIDGMEWESSLLDAATFVTPTPFQCPPEVTGYSVPYADVGFPAHFSTISPEPVYEFAEFNDHVGPATESVLSSHAPWEAISTMNGEGSTPIKPVHKHYPTGFGPRSATQEPFMRQPRRSGSIHRKRASDKPDGPSTRIPLEARQILEEEFSTNPYPCSWEFDIIAHQAKLDSKRVRNWFNNTRARKKPTGGNGPIQEKPNGSIHSLATKLSAESLEALSREVDEGVPTPQPPLAVYLASSYLEEAADMSDIQAAIDTAPSSERGDLFRDSSSGSHIGKSGSVITSLTSSDGSAPTSYTMSSRGSNNSSFGRDRRRGRRRMSWKTSPYNRSKIDGLDNAGLPARNSPFFCTFCPRAFKTKYEWIRHEDSVHALRTTWICCSSKQGPLQSCPFCGEMHPDEVHLASHKYQQCRNKPEAHRTFYRRDHFIQHLHHVHFANAKHPSVRFGCGTRTAAGPQDFGCRELAIKWRRFGAPMRPNDPMLHCGFCGKKLKDWNTRCDHVAEHLVSGGFDRSAWWPERKENHLENQCHPQAAGPFRCRYCQKVFENVGAMNNHTHCRVWSCRFLRTFDDVASENSGPPLCPQFPSPKAHHCHLCGAGYKSGHIEHAQQYHKYRLCKQDLYTSKDDFLQHLHDFHGASNPMLLLHNTVLEQHFSRNKGACFEPVDFDEILQGCRVATPNPSFVDPFPIQQAPLVQMVEDDSDSSPIDTPRKKPRDHVPVTADIPAKVHRERQELGKRKKSTEPQGPRIFRLDPLVPFLASRIYYLRNAKMSELFSDGKALLNEMEHSHVASLVMCSGLVGMAGVRMPIRTKRKSDDMGGVVEFRLED